MGVGGQEAARGKGQVRVGGGSTLCHTLFYTWFYTLRQTPSLLAGFALPNWRAATR
jgi:hypothetical protein